MSRPQFENQTLISATTSKSIEFVVVESTEDLVADVYERVTILSPKNTVSRVFNVQMMWEADTVATQGEKHLVIDSILDDETGVGMFRFGGAYNSKVMYDQGYFSGETYFYPDDLGAMSNQVNSITFDDIRGIQVVFRHTMNTITNSKRICVLFVEREVVAR